MKKGICILLCLLLCGLACLPAGAESGEDETRKLDQALARWGIAMTARMMANACDRLDSAEPDPSRAYYKDFSEIDFLRPYKMLVIDLTAEQAAAARDALGAERQLDIAPALAAYLNKDYPKYAQAVEQILPEETPTQDEAWALVLLPYGSHIAAVSFDGYSARSALVISMESSSRGLNAGEIGVYARQIGLEGLNIRMYSEQDTAELLDLGSWEGTYYGDAGALTSALAKNESRLRRLFPLTLGENTLSDQFRFYILRSYLEDAMREDLTGAARLISGTFLPMMAETSPDAADAFVEACRTPLDTFRDSRRPPEITYAEAAMPDPAGTYVFVMEVHHPEKGMESYYDPVLEAALPAASSSG